MCKEAYEGEREREKEVKFNCITNNEAENSFLIDTKLPGVLQLIFFLFHLHIGKWSGEKVRQKRKSIIYVSRLI